MHRGVATGQSRVAKGATATTHWSALEELAQLCPETIVVGGKRVVDSGSILTAAGVSAGIDLALYLVGGYLNGEISRFVAERMEYVLP